jgi:leucyl aminopeptidase
MWKVIPNLNWSVSRAPSKGVDLNGIDLIEVRFLSFQDRKRFLAMANEVGQTDDVEWIKSGAHYLLCPKLKWSEAQRSTSRQKAHERNPKSEPIDLLAFKFDLSSYAWARDMAGPLLSQWKSQKTDLHVKLVLDAKFESFERKSIYQGFSLGLELASYRFKDSLILSPGSRQPRESPGSKLKEKYSAQRVLWAQNEEEISWLNDGLILGQSMNLARHWVNLPPNRLHPEFAANEIPKMFSVANLKTPLPRSSKVRSSKGKAVARKTHRASVLVEVIKGKRLIQEKMELLAQVGRGAEYAPCLVHIKIRDSSSDSKGKFPALVGKGITFDSGGVNIKPANSMRLMKKDMGGAASLLGLCWYAAHQGGFNFDVFLPFAENSVDGKSFRPSDVIRARSGLMVEIHNTDAEGRLILADALDYALEKCPKATHIIDLATLTGAIKVGLGTEVAGLFCNDSRLACELMQSSAQTADWVWPMPLYPKYWKSFGTPFADLLNATDGWAGAITAALFLEKFVKQKPWAHLDIYAWNDKPQGAFLEEGGSAQAVQLLAHWLKMKGERG